MKIYFVAACVAALAIPHTYAEETVCKGSSLIGVVRDSTQALIPGASLKLENGEKTVSGSDGTFRFACVDGGAHTMSVTMEGFSKLDIAVKTPHGAALAVVLPLDTVETQVDVTADTTAATETNQSGPSQTIAGTRLQALADDPDDLLRELQQLAAASGGNPANTTIAVDGFQGSSALPPKSSIAYIKVNPDQYSAEYRQPPFDGARVEVYTKPGQKTYHGALFTTNGSPWENARDPFSTSKAAIGKQRYGFELTGPVRKAGSDFSLALEHRSIDNFAVVNAVTLNGATVANVATPQRLWIGNARLDWQLGPKNTLITSYSANVNHQVNSGVGGTALAETGYDQQKYEHMFRVSNITTASSHLMHETRVSLRWDGQNDTPNSTAPQVQVSGAFTGGGASIGAQRMHEFNLEVDDDAILTTKSHTLKAGTSLQMYKENNEMTTNFNGTYTFANLAQYQAGTPTEFNGVAGTPTVKFTQVTNALFVQDDWNVGKGVHIAGGVRWYMQNDPTTLTAAVPRLGILWSPGKKGTFTLHAHGGLFSGRSGESDYAEVLREDGVKRVTSQVNNPVYGNPFAGAPTVIHSMRLYAPHYSNLTWQIWNVGGTKTLPKGWNFSFDYHNGRIWNYTRTRNINQPLNDLPTGPRPFAANLNILQVQNSGQGSANAVFAGVENHDYKHVQFFFGGVRVALVDDADDDTFFQPQNAYSDAGEFSHRTNQNQWNAFGNATIKLPGKISYSINGNGGGDGHYNITTGADNNGDGNFNDRPQFAAPGTPGAVQTKYGLLVAQGGTGTLNRNIGQMPWKFYIDMNVQRAFTLTKNAKADHPQTLTLNVRSSNVLNHTNVTSVGGVLGSPLFGVPYAADNGRRVEAGARYSF